METVNKEILQTAAIKILAAWHKVSEEEFNADLMTKAVLTILDDMSSDAPKGYNEKFLLSLQGYLLAIDKVSIMDVSLQALYKTIIGMPVEDTTLTAVH